MIILGLTQYHEDEIGQYAMQANSTAKEYTDKALKANKDHQYTLKVHAERLETELKTIDKLLVRSAYVYLTSGTNLI